MFEGSLVESRGLVGSGTQRWSALGSVTFQFALAGLLLAIPLLHPGVLPMLVDAPKLVVPPPPKPPVMQVRVEPAASSSTAMSVPVETAAPAAAAHNLLSSIPGTDPGPAGLPMGPGMGDGLAAIGAGGPAPNVTVVRAKTPGRLNVSSGVSTGMLLSPIQPAYPPIAKAAGIQGTVVMEAVISKTGRIESLHAVSGPAMLRGAALDAVSAAHYKPYLLNGEPTEVQTTITVNFRLGN